MHTFFERTTCQEILLSFKISILCSRILSALNCIFLDINDGANKVTSLPIGSPKVAIIDTAVEGNDTILTFLLWKFPSKLDLIYSKSTEIPSTISIFLSVGRYTSLR